MTFVELVRTFSTKYFLFQLTLCQNWNILETNTDFDEVLTGLFLNSRLDFLEDESKRWKT